MGVYLFGIRLITNDINFRRLITNWTNCEDFFSHPLSQLVIQISGWSKLNRSFKMQFWRELKSTWGKIREWKRSYFYTLIRNVIVNRITRLSTSQIVSFFQFSTLINTSNWYYGAISIISFPFLKRAERPECEVPWWRAFTN